VHHEGPGGEPEGLEEVLCLAVARQRQRIDAGTALRPTPVEHRVDELLPDADRTSARLDVDVGQQPEAAAVTQVLDGDGGVAHHGLVDGADQHQPSRIGDVVRQRRDGRDRPRFAHRPHRSPPAVDLLGHGGGRQLGQPREVCLRGRPSGLLHDCSWAIRPRTVLRPRCASS
jgi:hypothetical protein